MLSPRGEECGGGSSVTSIETVGGPIAASICDTDGTENEGVISMVTHICDVTAAGL